MNKLLIVAGILTPLVLFSVPVQADTTDQNALPAVVVPITPVIVIKTEDPKDLEGEIIRVDMPESMIVVQDANNRERKVTLKQGMIDAYKVGDYVQVHLMADLKEAKTIKTVRTADLEGDVVVADLAGNQIVVRDSDPMDHVVLLNPAMNNKYVVGDHVRLYVVSDMPDVKEVRLIRVK